MNAKIDELAQKLTGVTIDADLDREDIFLALELVYIFWLSTLCPECRQDIAKHLKKNVAAMLARADEIAGEASEHHIH